MRNILGTLLLAFCLLVNAREHHRKESTPTSSLTDAFTDNTDETAASSSLSDSLKQPNNDWLTDDDDDDDDENLDEGQLNVQPKAKSLASPTPASTAKPTTVKPMSNEQLENKVFSSLNAARQLFGAGPCIRLESLDLGARISNREMQKKGLPKNDPRIKHGQLQCIKKTSPHKLGAECVAIWFGQMQDYDWSNPAIKANNKFFVQAAYKGSTHGGISIKKGPSGKYFVTVLLDPPADKNKLKDNVKSYSDLFSAVPGAKCSTAYTDFQGSCYKLRKDKQSWMNAKAECLKELAVLPAIASRAENEFFKQGLLKGESNFAWIGFNDRLKESMYMSVDGSQIRYMNWVNGQPTGKGQNCVGFDIKAKYGTMADYACTTPSIYVCKKPLEGDITYLIKLQLLTMMWLDDLGNSASLAYQQLEKKLRDAIKSIFTKAGIKVLKSVSVMSVSNGSPPQMSYSAAPGPAPAPARYGYYGKRQVVPVNVKPAPTAAPSPKPSGGSTPSGKPITKAPTTKPSKKPTLKLALTFGPSGIPDDPTAALQNYLRANKNKLPAPLNEEAKLLSISIAPPGSVSSTPCNPMCSYSCISSCPPSCCLASPAAPAAAAYPAPCGPPPMSPCNSPPQPTVAATPQTPKPKAPARRPPSQAKCIPTPISSCPPPVSYPYPQQAYPMAPPCVPGPMNNYCRSRIGMRPFALNRNRFLVRKPIPVRTTAYRYPFQPYRRIVPRLVSSRPVSRAVMPFAQGAAYGASPCIPTPYSPCPPPAPMMVPQYAAPQAVPCYLNPLNPCNKARKAPPKKLPVKMAQPKTLSLIGQTYPASSLVMLPPPPPLPYMPAPMPCIPTPVSPCPPRVGPMKAKSVAPKPCAPSTANSCPPAAPPMPMPMPMPMPLPMTMPCTPTATQLCPKPKKPPPPKPMLIKLPAIQIQVPQQPPPVPQPPIMPPQPPPMPCPPPCMSLPTCLSSCPPTCCSKTRSGRSV